MKDEETIAAISTPMGEGGIGIIRISGDKSFEITKKIFKPVSEVREIRSRHLYLGHIIDPEKGNRIDEVLTAFYKSPHTYTREDMVEINCHGGMVAQKKILELAIKYGARIAEPGEFTKRAFLNGRIDLSQAEAVIDIIRSKTERALMLANRQLAGGFSEMIKSIRSELVQIMAHIEANIDFPEDDIPEADPVQIKNEIQKSKNRIKMAIKNLESGKMLRDGLSTIILGRTNVGKSSLLNALLNEERAIVTDVPGTTRDIIEEYININGIPVKIIDTAGIRETGDKVEMIGVERAKRYLNEAEMVLLVIDASIEITEEDRRIFDMAKDKFAVIVINKTDLPSRIDEKEIEKILPEKKIIRISALKNQGIEELKNEIYNSIVEKMGPIDENAIIATQRQKKAMEDAASYLEKALKSLEENMPIEVIEIDIRESWEKLGEIIGDTASEDIINAIFENFCIGK
ncbi:MAG: tRNA uridine-5-carboxymethylaminomethyl(34) synthesis GTPase MnmE [Tepidanaerobacteraceae bacterium]|jgi:tRNA modification GTPase|nr:tRNA uridine-5-carboxymethylaminomethyl(34) synthesis GTPase MnmE [Tepidanaerobacteraceae bacterium]